jgi:hypothetical protein
MSTPTMVGLFDSPSVAPTATTTSQPTEAPAVERPPVEHQPATQSPCQFPADLQGIPRKRGTSRKHTSGIRLTDRDRQALRLIDEMWMVRSDHMHRYLETLSGPICPERARQIMVRWEQANLVVRRATYHNGPRHLALTEHARSQGLGQYSCSSGNMSPAHRDIANATRLACRALWPDAEWKCERFLKTTDVYASLHRPDGLLLKPQPDGTTWTMAFEIETSLKSKRDLSEVIEGLVAGGYDEVIYVCGTRAIERLVTDTVAGITTPLFTIRHVSVFGEKESL